MLKGAQCHQESGSQNKVPLSIFLAGKNFKVCYEQ